MTEPLSCLYILPFITQFNSYSPYFRYFWKKFSSIRVLALLILLMPAFSTHAYAQDLTFKKGYALVAEKLIPVEFAANPDQREAGLSGRGLDKKKYFMVFTFDYPQKANFWMKNTKIDLSIAFINSKNKVDEIKNMKANSLLVIESKSSEIKYAFEAPKGYFAQNKIKVGDSFQIFNKKPPI